MFFSFSLATVSSAQELFIRNMPASTIPKNSFEIRAFTEWYDEGGSIRGMGAFGFGYGIFKNLMVRISATASNHHGEYLPENLITHTHIGSQTISFSQNRVQASSLPVLFSGIHSYLQYRFLNVDGYKKHLRLAVFGAYSSAKSAHDEAESNLWDDNSGFEFGYIVSYLKNRWAFSFNNSIRLPEPYSEINPKGVETTLTYGNTIPFNLSIGYLLAPAVYESYNQRNTNLYLEFMGRWVDPLERIVQDDVDIEIRSDGHLGGWYIEMHPGIQFVYSAQTRVELSVGLPFVDRSYAHFTPIFHLGLRHLFF